MPSRILSIAVRPTWEPTVTSEASATVITASESGWGRRVTRMYIGSDWHTPRSCDFVSMPPAPSVPSMEHHGLKSYLDSKNSIL